jgi:hypothetical membrane protein
MFRTIHDARVLRDGVGFIRNWQPGYDSTTAFFFFFLFIQVTTFRLEVQSKKPAHAGEPDIVHMVFLFFLFFSSASVNGLGIMEWRRVCFARVFFLGLVVRSEYTVKREVVNHGIPRSGLFSSFFF